MFVFLPILIEIKGAGKDEPEKFRHFLLLFLDPLLGSPLFGVWRVRQP